MGKRWQEDRGHSKTSEGLWQGSSWETMVVRTRRVSMKGVR